MKKLSKGSSKSHLGRKLDEEGNKDLEVLRPVNKWYRTAFNYRSYQFAEQSQIYDEKVVKNVSKCVSQLQVQMSLQQLDPMDPVPFFICTQNKLQQKSRSRGCRDAEWAPFYGSGACGSAADCKNTVDIKIYQENGKGRRTNGYSQVVNHLQEIYTAYDIIMEVDFEII